jgi:hypothetical protein
MKKIFIRPLLLLILTFLYLDIPAVSQEKFNSWKAGVAKVNITPQEHMWMAGYAARNKPSEGKLHDLWAKALVLEDAEGKLAVLITTDLVGIRQELSNRIRDGLKAKYDLSRDQVILNSSHTHTGPETDVSRHKFHLDQDELNKIEKYAQRLEDQIIGLVGEAMESRETVRIFSENGVTRFQVNRRNNKEADLTPLTELKGPNDYSVPVLKVLDQKDELMAVAFGYACHPTVLSGYNWSGDYVGFAQLELEKAYPGTTALFFQGAGADQNPLPRRSVALAKQYGQELAAAVSRVLKEEMQPLSADLATNYSEIDLIFANPAPSQEELLQIIDSSDYPDYLKHSAKVLLDDLEKGKQLITSYPYPVQVWKIGEQPIISLGGEVLVGYAIAIKQIFGQDTFIMGYSNDVMAYIPTAKELAEGGYEGTRSPIFTTPWASNIEQRILQEVLQLAEQAGISQTDAPVTEN